MGPFIGRFDTINSPTGFSFLSFSASAVIAMMLVLLAVVLPFSTVFATPVKILQSDPSHLSLKLENLDIQWREIVLEGGDVVLFDPQVSGLSTSGEPGGVRLPRTGGWLLVPPGTSPRVVSRQENWGPVGNRALMVEGIPIIVEETESSFSTSSEIFVLPGEEIPENAPIPQDVRESLGNRLKQAGGPALELGEISWWHGHRIVSWRLNILKHDGRIATAVLASGQWDIAFEKSDAVEQTIPAGHSSITGTRSEERFSGIFLNSNILEGLSSEAKHRGFVSPLVEKVAKRGGKSGTLLAPVEGRLGVQRSQLFRVTYDRLHAFGFIPDLPVQESQIRMYQRRYLPRLDDGSTDAPYVEVEVPILMVGEGDAFDGDDYFIFYGLRLRDDTDFTVDVGQGVESIYGCGDNHEKNNTANYYWLSASEPDVGESWARMQEQTMAAASGEPLAKYRRVEHHEEQESYRQNPPRIAADRLFYNHFRVAEVSVGINPLWSPDISGDDVTVDVELAGFTDSEKNLHLELVTDNSLITTVDDFLLSDPDMVIRHNQVPASALDGETCKLIMRPNVGSAVYSWLNWVEISYDALYKALGNKLEFHGNEQSGVRPMVVTGFTNDDIGLIEITDPRNPIHYILDGGNILADGDHWKLSLAPVQSSGARLFVAQGSFTGLGVGEFNYYESTKALDPVNPLELSGSNPDLVVITHPEFREALERWITHRKNRVDGELEVHVVEVQDLYDWYSGGLRDPWALKRFTNHAISHWGSWALMLVGDANENALELGATGLAKDWVPTNFHIQSTGQYKPEVAASDKWYATFESGMNYPVDDFRNSATVPWEMYVGRFPCNSVDELNTMIDKVIAMENVQAEQDWRKRAILIADDHWSEGSLPADIGFLIAKTSEWAFSNVERFSMAPMWDTGSPVTLVADTLFLNNYLRTLWIEQFRPYHRIPRDYIAEVIDSYAHRDLLAALNLGGLIAHYQGHANASVLCSEYWFEDIAGSVDRQDVQFLTNADRPWVFFGMGCHISDWAQDPVSLGISPHEPSLGEKFLTWSGGGGCATYGSSVYEYITQNRVYGEYLMRRWIEKPPHQMQFPGSGEAVSFRSRWMLGELLWSSEADIMATYVPSTHYPNLYRDMVSQFVLLGDPLMVMDAGPPVVSAVLSGDPDQEISGEENLVSGDAQNLKVINIEARDEAGIARLRVTDSTGADLTASLVTESLPAGQVDHQWVNYRLDVPVRPFEHQIQVEVFDTGGPLTGDRHYSLQLNVLMDAVFTIDGEVIDDNYHFVMDEPVSFQCQLTSGAWLDDSMQYTLRGENLEVSSPVFGNEKSNSLSFSFTATATDETTEGRSVVLVIDDYETTYPLESAAGSNPDATISRVLNYPNPMREGTRFLFETTATSGQGMVRVFAVSGRVVANLPFSYTGAGDNVIEWNGLDSDGDRLANGTYLYRLEMNTSSGLLVSPMQRLVVMN